MSQRQLLTGGVQLHDVLPAPTVFAEPSSLSFVNRDDASSTTETPATYTNITGLPGFTTFFFSWFAATTSAVQNGAQEIDVHWENAPGPSGVVEFVHSGRLPSGQEWYTTPGVNFINSAKTEHLTEISQEDAGAPLGGIRAAFHLAFPVNDIGVSMQDWFQTGFGLGEAGNNDVDATITGSDFDIKSTEEYLILWTITNSAQDSSVFRNIRWNPLIDDVDITNVRTNSTSGGAVRTGRGFSVGKGDAGLTGNVGDFTFTGATIQPLQKGLRTPTFKSSIAEDLAGINKFMSPFMFLFRKSMFEQSSIAKVTTRQQNTSETHLDTDFQVAINSTKKVWIIVSSTYMGSHEDLEVVLHREAAGGGGDVDLIAPVGLKALTGATTGQLLNTDQSTMPLWIAYVDDAPGDVVYTLRLGRGSSGSQLNTINMRDDGTDGFNGLMAALELSFGTDT